MELRFDGLTALVTGATSGIGQAIADGLASSGATVVRHGLGDGDLDIDLAEAGAGRRLASAALAHAGQIDILVHAASIQVRRPWDELTTEEFEEQVRVDLTASFELLQVLAAPMAARGWGRVVTIGSIQQARPHPQMLAYAASKSGQLTIVRSLAAECAPRGVTVNNVAPGVIETPRNAAALTDPDYRARVLAGIPAGRVGAPADCVAPVLLLCAREAGYLTGLDLAVDGGMAL